MPPAAAFLDAQGSLEGTQQEVREQFQKLVDDVVRGLKRRGVVAEGVVRHGSPGKTIVDEAKDWDADLVVVGSHGLTGLESILMGNVARYVVNHAPCSVEVVRPKKR